MLGAPALVAVGIGATIGSGVFALTGTVAPDAIEQARRLAISDLVAKFDRSGLLAALAEIGEAAQAADARAAA